MTYDPKPLFLAWRDVQATTYDEDPTANEAAWEAYVTLANVAPRCEVCGDLPIWCPTWDSLREEALRA